MATEQFSPVLVGSASPVIELGKGGSPMRERGCWRVARAPVVALVLVFLGTSCTGTQGASAPPGGVSQKPHLQLSRTSGGPGTTVRINASSCPMPPSSVNVGPSLYFHDSYNRTKTGAALNAGLREPKRHQHGSLAEATYQVTSNDSTGPGLFVIFCGTTVLDADFTVT
jgi:hypothetical protein